MLHLTQARSQPAVKRQARHPAAHASEAEVPVSTTAVVATSAWIVDPLLMNDPASLVGLLLLFLQPLESVLHSCSASSTLLDVRVHA